MSPLTHTLMATLLCAALAPALPVAADVDLPDTMPAVIAPDAVPRALGLGMAAWEKIPGYAQPSQPDRLVVRDFAPVPLADGSVVFPGLGVRLRDTTVAKQQVVEIVDIQEYGPVWMLRENPAYQIGGLLGGRVSTIEQALRVELSRSGEKKTRQGFSIPIAKATPYQYKGQDRVQVLPGRLRVDPMVQPRGRWLVAQPDADPAEPTPADKHEALAAEFRSQLDAGPCALDGLALMTFERRMEVIERASDTPLPFVNFRQEQQAACAIATHGAYPLEDMQRLAVLRQATCADLEGGLSEAIRDRAEVLRRQVGPPRYLDYAQIGVYDLTEPTRVPDPAGQADRRACILNHLEEALFAPD